MGETQDVAAQLARRQDPRDAELFAALCDHLIAAGQEEAALTVWNGYQRYPAIERASPGALTNGNFQINPSGHGFDWRVTVPPEGSAHWDPARLHFWLSSSMPDACPLLMQWVVLAPGRYRLRFAYRTEGLAAQTGLRWILMRGAREEAASPVLGHMPGPLSEGRKTAWDFTVNKTSLFLMQLVYARLPGTTPVEGRAEIGSAVLEIL